MPSVSAKQHRYMEGIAHGMKPRGKGPSVAVAKDFVAADKRTSGQFRSKAEKTGRVVGGKTGELTHPQNNDQFHALGE